MALQLFGRKKDRDTQKGQRWLKELGITFSFVDLDEKPLSPGELDSIARAVGGHDRVVDTEGSAYRNGGWSHRAFDAREELLGHPELVRAPILRNSPRAVAGFDESRWKELAR